MFGTRVKPQLLFVDRLQDVGGETFQKRDPSCEAFRKILDFSAHRGLGDRCDLFFYAAKGSDFINAFDVDECRIHVHGEYFAVTESAARNNISGIDQTAFAPGEYFRTYLGAVVHSQQPCGRRADAPYARGFCNRCSLLDQIC